MKMNLEEQEKFYQKRCLDIYHGLEVMDIPGVIELRIIGKQKAFGGYFTDLNELAGYAYHYNEEQNHNVYITLNPVQEELLGRASNKIDKYLTDLTGDKHIVKRVWLPLDFDPVRPSGISATEEERLLAINQAKTCREWLRQQGFPEPVFASSGNGAHLLYRIDLPNTSEVTEAIRHFILAMDLQFTTKTVDVDKTVFNASRIWKLYGAKAIKGENLPERPHRISMVLEKPDVMETVSLEQIKAVGATLVDLKKAKATYKQPRGKRIDLLSWLTEHEIGVVSKDGKPCYDGQIWNLVHCPFSDAHTDGAYAWQHKDGAIKVGCHHNSCEGKGWHELRDIHEPDWCEKDKKGRGRPAEDLAKREEQVEELELESLTDTGNAKWLVRLFGKHLRYTGQLGWLVWDGTRWKVDDAGEVDRNAKLVPEKLKHVAKSIDDEKFRNAVIRHANQSLNQNRLDAMKKNASTEKAVRIRHDIFDADPLLFNVLNGTVDLKTGQLLPHNQEHYLTKIAPITFRQDATCPNWMQFLTEIMCEDDELVRFLQRVVGYTLTGLTSEQCLFILHGSGANGKSAFLNLLKHLFGEYGKVAEFKTFTERKNDSIRNDLARLAGARFVAGSEGDSGSYLSESIVKSLTGGDMIAARFLHKEYFEFQPIFKLFLATNHKPYIGNQDEGIWRRIRLVPFEHYVPQDDRNPHLVEDVLVPELPGILNWAIQGCLAWQGGGLQPPTVVLEATEEYREEMDTLAPFLEACFYQRSDYQTPSAEINKIYVKWCQDNNIKKPLANNTLINKLKERKFESYRTRTERGLKGLKPKLSVRNLSNLNISDVMNYKN